MVSWRHPQWKGPEPLASLKDSIDAVQPKVENSLEVATQPEVEEVPEGLHPEDVNPNSSHEEYRMGRSKSPHSLIMENLDEWVDDHEEIATNYVESGESYHRKTTIINIYFVSKIADSLDLDLEPKSMIECQKRSDWDKWKATIEAELCSLYKKRGFWACSPKTS
jgi:hypothetical protein